MAGLADQLAGRVGQHQVGGEPQVALEGLPAGHAELQLEVDQPVAHPLVDLGQLGQRVGQLGRGGGRGDPRQAAALGHGAGGQRLLVGDDHVGLELVDGGVDPGGHGLGQREEHVLPQELEGGRAPQPLGLAGDRRHGVAHRRGVVGGDERRALGQQRGDEAGGPGPGDGVAPGGQLAAQRDRGVHVAGERRDDDQEAAHGATASRGSSAAGRGSPSQASARSTSSGPASISSEWLQSSQHDQLAVGDRGRQRLAPVEDVGLGAVEGERRAR